MDRRKVDVVVMTMLMIVSIIILTNDNLSETELGSLFLPRIVAGFIIAFSLFIGSCALIKVFWKR